MSTLTFLRSAIFVISFTCVLFPDAFGQSPSAIVQPDNTVKYTAGGSGPTSRDLGDRLNESLSLYDFCPASQRANLQVNASPYLQTAVNAACTSGKRLYIPTGGAIKLLSTVTIPSSVDIYGDANATTLQVSFSGFAFTINTTTQVKIHDLNIVGDSAVANTGGIYVTAPQYENGYSRFENLIIIKCTKGIFFDKAALWTVEKCVLIGGTHGIWAANNHFFDGGDCSISNSSFFGCTNSVYYQSGGGLRVINNKFNSNGNGKETAVALNASLGDNVKTVDLFFIGNSVESYTSYGLILQGPPTATFGNVIVSANEFVDYSKDSTGMPIGINGKIDHVSITGNVIRNKNTPAIYLKGVRTGIVTGNAIQPLKGYPSARAFHIENDCADIRLYPNSIIGQTLPSIFGKMLSDYLQPGVSTMTNEYTNLSRWKDFNQGVTTFALADSPANSGLYKGYTAGIISNFKVSASSSALGYQILSTINFDTPSSKWLTFRKAASDSTWTSWTRLLTEDDLPFTQSSVYTLTGGATSETLSLSIPSGTFSAKPQTVLVQYTGGAGSQPLVVAHNYDDTLNSATVIRVKVSRLDGVNISGGLIRLSILARP